MTLYKIPLKQIISTNSKFEMTYERFPIPFNDLSSYLIKTRNIIVKRKSENIPYRKVDKQIRSVVSFARYRVQFVVSLYNASYNMDLVREQQCSHSSTFSINIGLRIDSKSHIFHSQRNRN